MKCGFWNGHCWHQLPNKVWIEKHVKFEVEKGAIFTYECCKCGEQRKSYRPYAGSWWQE